MDRILQAANYLRAMRGNTLITFQSLGDMDAVASSIALSKLVKNSSVMATGNVDSQSRAVLRSLGLSVQKIESLKGFQNIIIADSCTSDSLGKWGSAIEEDFFGKLVIIDHHYHSGKIKADFELLMPSASSTSEIVFRMLKESKIRIDRKTALLLAAGIAADTAFWKSANDDSFFAMAQLLEAAGRSKADYQKILKLLDRPKDHAMTEKLVEAVRTATMHRKGGIMVATTSSHAFHLQCALSLVGLGCDYAFVIDSERGIVLGARSDNAAANMGMLMEKVAAMMGNGSGGGHEKVGGARGEIRSQDELLEYCTSCAFGEERLE